jgi:hypothetical protein
VRSLTGMHNDGWLEDRRVLGVLYDGDKLKKTRKIGVGDGV